jgi:hypothetical protein
MSASSMRSASKKRNPLNDVNTGDDASTSGRKSRSSSAHKARGSQRGGGGENSIDDDASTASAATVGSAQMAELQELDSSVMSAANGRADGDQTASLADLAKLMQSPAEGDDTDEDEKTSRVNSRRQTADPAAMMELNAMFASDSDEDEEEDGADGAGAKDAVAAATVAATNASAFASPARTEQQEEEAAASKVPTPKPLKSCISARKPKSSKGGAGAGRSSVRKGVRFGSPDAAEFHNDMATSSVTPLPKAFTKQRYQMVSPETQAQAVRAETDENSRILAELSDEDDAVSCGCLRVRARVKERDEERGERGGPCVRADANRSPHMCIISSPTHNSLGHHPRAFLCFRVRVRVCACACARACVRLAARAGRSDVRRAFP